jgi:Lon protease-like protein
MMFSLSLFPLNTVLFPGMPISLHIFEDRYKQMINLCIDTRQTFGVVLIREGDEALGLLAEPYPVGCTAQITQVERLADGRMNIIAVGLERFQILSLNAEKPYLMGYGTLPTGQHRRAHDGTSRAAAFPGRRHLSCCRACWTEVSDRLPDDFRWRWHLAAAVVNSCRQANALASGQAAEFITDISTVFRREVALLKAIVARDKPGDLGPFSMN